MGNSTVVLDWLVDLNGVILEVEENRAFADAELFLAALVHSLAEESLEAKDLAIKGDPGRKLTLAGCLGVHVG